ncbi:MAG: PAS domain S-box protein [bacterium]|nr:PAS domain S-box protein [bacterium]
MKNQERRSRRDVDASSEGDAATRPNRGAGHHENDGHLELIASHATDGVACLTTDGVMHYVSPAWCALFGYAKGEVIGRPATDFVHEEDASALEDAMERCRSGEHVVLVYRRKMGDGTFAWSESTGHMVTDEPDHAGEFICVTRDITKRKGAEDALRESEKRLRMVLDAACDGVWDQDLTSRELRFNPQWAELLGYDPHDIVPDASVWRELMHPDDWPDVVAAFEDHLDGRTPQFRAEFRLRNKEGEWQWVLSRGRVVSWNSDLEPARAVGTLTDISDRKAGEHALRESEHYNRNLFESCPVGLILCGFDGRFIDVNPKFARILGHSRKAVLDMAWHDVTPPEYTQPDLGQVQILRDTGTFGPYEKEYVRKDGSRVPVRLVGRVIEKGDERCIWSTVEDISEAKLARDALRRSVEQYRTVFDSSGDGLVISDLDGVVRDVNPAFCAMHGYARDELVGTYTKDVIHEDHHAAVDAFLSHVAKGEGMVVPGVDVRKGGDAFPVEVHGAPISFNDAPHVLAVVRDVTERKRAEEERRALEARMQEAQRRESLSSLAGGIAHEFNNLLTGILGNAQLILDGDGDGAEVVLGAEEIRDSAMRAADLSMQMLIFSGRGAYTLEPMDLNATVDEVAQLVAGIVSNHVSLQCDLCADAPVFRGDRGQVRLAILNLGTNAAEAVGDRGGSVSISTGVIDCDREYFRGSQLGDDCPPGAYVYVEVADTGCGIDEETLDRVFDPFYTTKFTGRGLGLSAVMGIVRAHSGAIRIHSRPGKGATVRVLFPKAGIVEPDTANRDEGADDAGMAGLILVVDDERTVRSVSRRFLQRAGFEVITAKDGLEAVQVYRHRGDEIALVVLDLTMPYMGGRETYDELQQIRPDVRVVLASGYSEDEVAGRFEDSGVAGFLQKPFRSEDLVRAVRRALASQR